MIILEFKRGPQAGRVVELDQHQIMLGRDPDADVVLLDQRASWSHCAIEWSEKGYVIIDQGSSNGTYLGDDLRPVTVPERLSYGESIWFGDTEVVFKTNLEVQGSAQSSEQNKAPVGATMTISAHEALKMMEQVHLLKQSRERRKRPAGQNRNLDSNPAEIWEGITDESVFVDYALTEEDLDGFPESFRLRARLSFLSGPHEGREVFLGSATTTFGRDAENTVPLDDDLCSSVHAEITRDDRGIYYLRDMGSRNGTGLNGKDIRDRQPIQHRALLSIGQSIVEFHAEHIDQRTENPLATVAMSLPLYAFQGKVLTQYEITLGLDPTSDVFLDDRSVDRHNATISWKGDHFQIRDTSNRGTKVNNKRIIQQDLHDGDVIAIGVFNLTLKIEGMRCNLEIARQAVKEEGAEMMVAAAPERANYKTIFRIDVPDVLKKQQRVPVKKDDTIEGMGATGAVRKQLTYVAPLETRPSWRNPLLVSAGVLTVLLFGAAFTLTGGGLYMNDPLSSAHNSKAFAAVAGQLDGVSGDCGGCHSFFQGISQANCEGCHSEVSFRAGHLASVKDGDKDHGEVAQGGFNAACDSCHSEHQSREELRAAAEATCVGCHSENPHARLKPDKVESPQGIATAQAKAKKVKMNKALSVDELHKAHSGIARRCVGCHAEADESGPVADPRTSCGRCHKIALSDEPTYKECTGCHAPAHQVVKDGEQVNTAQLAALVDISKDDLEAESLPFAAAENFRVGSLAKGLGLTFLLILPLGFVLSGHGVMSYVFRKKPEDFIPPENPDNWHVLIDPEKCVGTAACAYACPYNVIEMVPVDGKPKLKLAEAERIGACHGCKACVRACLPGAIIVLKAGEGLPEKSFPDVDPYYQVADMPGLFLAGDVTQFKGSVKNAANMGYRVAEYITKVQKTAPGAAQAKGLQYEVFVAGGGPGGIAAAVSAKKAGLSYHISEKSSGTASLQRERWQLGKPMQPTPPSLDPIGPVIIDEKLSNREDVLELFDRTVAYEGIDIQFREEVTGVKPIDGGGYTVTTNNGEFTALNVILASGGGSPRKARCPGADLDKVKYALVDKNEFKGKRIVVLGGGNMAVEIAFALAAENEVVLSYRKNATKMSITGDNRQILNDKVAKGEMKTMLETNPAEITEDSVVLEHGKTKERTTLPNDIVFVCFGQASPQRWLEKIGVKFVKKPANWNPGPTSDLSFLNNA